MHEAVRPHVRQVRRSSPCSVRGCHAHRLPRGAGGKYFKSSSGPQEQEQIALWGLRVSVVRIL